MKKILAYIQSNFLLRNILLAVCLILVSAYVVSLMLNIFTRHNQKHIVPSFIGMSVGEARELAKKDKLEIVVVDSLFIPKGKPGMILDQSPKADMGVKSGRKIFLTINSFRPKMEIIPYVSGFSLRQAKNKLESKGFEIDQLVYQSDMATNNVLSQKWNGQTITRGSEVKAELGSGITLVVGKDSEAPIPIVPKVIGLTLREAKSRLWEIGFNIGEIRYDPGIDPEEYERARVYKQTPSQEARSDYGTKVTLWLTLDTKRLNTSSKEADQAARQEIQSSDETEGVSEEQMLRELGVEE